MFSDPAGVTPSEFREDFDIHKTRMNGLSCHDSCGEESMTICSICSAVLITIPACDRRTDVQPISIISIADVRN